MNQQELTSILKSLPTFTNALKTSEFYAFVATFISGIFITSGQLTPGEADGFQQAVMAVVGGVMSLGSTVMIIKSRTDLRRDWASLAQAAISQIDSLLDSVETEAGGSPVDTGYSAISPTEAESLARPLTGQAPAAPAVEAPSPQMEYPQ